MPIRSDIPRPHRSSLSAETVARIGKLLKAGESLAEVATKCGVAKSTVWNEANRAGIRFIRRRAGRREVAGVAVMTVPAADSVAPDEAERRYWRGQIFNARWGYSTHRHAD